MISIILTNRNRDLRIIKRNLDSLSGQSSKNFKLILVDYGSEKEYLFNFRNLLLQYDFVNLIVCPTSGQLWNKSRAINIVLKICTTPYVFIGDIDMIFDFNFIQRLYEIKREGEVFYFKVGFLSQEESAKNLGFDEYKVSFYSNREATGMTLYPTELLFEINGYDEFYHGWGGEDTDVHIRLNNLRVPIHFYDKEILIKHQWHPKRYRSKASLEPFHSKLEKINHQYIKHVEKFQIVKANKNAEIGLIPHDSEYEKLQGVENIYQVFSEVFEIDSFLNGTIHNLPKGVYQIDFLRHPLSNSIKNKVKHLLGKKAYKFYPLNDINDNLLSVIVLNFRNNPYRLTLNREKQILSLTILIN